MNDERVRWIARLEACEPWLNTAHPGIRRDDRIEEGRPASSQIQPSPTVWIARHADAAHWPLPPPEPADLADAARARRDGGAGRLLRRRMLRALIGRALAIHPSIVRFTRDPHGAPGLEGLPAFISTAGCEADGEAWSAVALSPAPIGIDLEPGPATEPLTRWTLTEAYLKALGRGLAVAPEQVRLQPTEGGRWRLALDGAWGGKGRVRPGPSVIAAVVELLDDRGRKAGP